MFKSNNRGDSSIIQTGLLLFMALAGLALLFNLGGCNESKMKELEVKMVEAQARLIEAQNASTNRVD